MPLLFLFTLYFFLISWKVFLLRTAAVKSVALPETEPCGRLIQMHWSMGHPSYSHREVITSYSQRHESRKTPLAKRGNITFHSNCSFHLIFWLFLFSAALLPQRIYRIVVSVFPSTGTWSVGWHLRSHTQIHSLAPYYLRSAIFHWLAFHSIQIRSHVKWFYS